MLYDFRIEYRENPIGIDNPPRFSWKIKSNHPNLVQTAYQIQVTGGGKLMWDSGCVKSCQSVLVPYGGKPLEPMSVYQVQVSVLDNTGGLGQKENGSPTLFRRKKRRVRYMSDILRQRSR